MQNIFSVLFTESLCTAFFFRHSEIFLASQHYVLVNNVKIIMKIPRNCTWGKCTAADLGYCVPYLTTHKYSGNIYSVVRRNLNKEYVQRVKEQESRDQPKYHLSKTTDYGRPERKKPSLHGRKFIPKFLGTAEAYFVCHFGPIFQISLIYAFIGCP